MKRILVGAPIRQTPAILKAHLRTLEWQQLPPDTKIDYHVIDDCLDPESSALLRPFTPFPAPIDAEEGSYAKEEQTTLWTVEAFHRMAHMRQQILNAAIEGGYDYVFMADSDLLLDPFTLSSLLSAEKPIVSAVFWTAWQLGTPPLPQVWLTQPYGLSGRGMAEHEFFRSLRSRQLTQVWGLGACTLISRPAIERGAAYAPLLDDLPKGGIWEGEDRSFCIRADRAHVEMWADPWPRVSHIYRPSDEESIGERMEELERAKPERATLGSWISAVIEPLQEPHLASWKHHIRGQMGRMRMVKGVEKVLLEVPIGEPAIHSIYFPIDYPLPVYAGQEKMLRIELLDVREE